MTFPSSYLALHFLVFLFYHTVLPNFLRIAVTLSRVVFDGRSFFGLAFILVASAIFAQASFYSFKR